MKKKKNRLLVARMKPEKGSEWLLQQHLALYQLVVPYVKKKKVLDAGCGYGFGAWFWRQKGAAYVEAYDLSEKALRFARKKYRTANLKFKKLDFNQDQFPRPGFFDVACSIEVIEHLQNPSFYLKNLQQSLKKGGRLFLTTPNAALSSSKNRYHCHEFTDKELGTLLKKMNFKILKRKSLSINQVSKLSGRYLPSFLLSEFKKMPFYATMVKGWCQPRISQQTKNGETLIYWAKKE